MRILSLLIFCVLLLFLNVRSDSPHGAGFKISCKTCHSTKGWQLDKEIYSFNHNTTKLPLVGQHSQINCRQCHISLVFKEAKSECFQCHNDVHQATVGKDCSRCHTSDSWLVKNINEIHNRSRFPLIGAHRTADCLQCHKSESQTRFEVAGVNCIDCHRQNYLAATNPNHVQSGMSEDCSLCHPANAFQWTGAGFNHAFFPLTQAHSTAKCADCHKTANFKDAKPDCYSCHQQDFAAAKNPDHTAAQISTIMQVSR
jgi:Zn finger protein HypA/HybF involved in hydrogenase expression